MGPPGGEAGSGSGSADASGFWRFILNFDQQKPPSVLPLLAELPVVVSGIGVRSKPVPRAGSLLHPSQWFAGYHHVS